MIRDSCLQNFAVLSKGGTQQVSLMNVAMELKKASSVPVCGARYSLIVPETIPIYSTVPKTEISR